MRTCSAFLLCSLIISLSSKLLCQSEEAIIINHKSIDLNQILDNSFISKAKGELYIGYGHTSHGSQLITGMNALMSYYTDGRFDWSSNGGAGFLKISEGGTLSEDCGYSGWDDKTRTYLDNTPQCNVIIWSWCGQVNDVDLNEHYLSRLNKLELDYPKVKFIYMTGHLEGQGPDGSLEKANNTIRKFCNDNHKILFDFADIEKYSPDGDINYDEYFADDGCNYTKPGGGTGNWADEWMQSNPDNILTKIADKSSDCAHSVNLNCVMKGIASWHLWARLAGWEGGMSSIASDAREDHTFISPNPASDYIEIYLGNTHAYSLQQEIKIYNTLGECVLAPLAFGEVTGVRLDISALAPGVYFVRIGDSVIKFEKR